jgi:hypothetical protein
LSKDLAKQFASRFIARPGVKAVQMPDGTYTPDYRLRGFPNGAALAAEHGEGFDMASLLRHINKESVYGHYLLNEKDEAKVCVFDIDLEKTGNWVAMPGLGEMSPWMDNDTFDKLCVVHEDVNPRELWLNRTKAAIEARRWYKYQMMQLVHKFARVITTDLGLPCATAYSGSKGVHVYAFTGLLPAKEVREAGFLVMDIINEFQPTRGDNFYQHKNLDAKRGFQNFKIEVYPKQESLEGKSLGNLVRLPMGKNAKSRDPAFFIDMKSPIWEMRPHPNPLELLTSGDPYA